MVRNLKRKVNNASYQNLTETLETRTGHSYGDLPTILEWCNCWYNLIGKSNQRWGDTYEYDTARCTEGTE